MLLLFLPAVFLNYLTTLAIKTKKYRPFVGGTDSLSGILFSLQADSMAVSVLLVSVSSPSINEGFRFSFLLIK